MTNRDISDHIPSQVDPNGTSLQSTSHTGENAPSTGGHSKPQTTFSDLPAELRNMIWHEALAPRVIMIYPCDSRVETDSLNQVDFDKIPGMLFANQESRRIALHHYDQRFTLKFTQRVPTPTIPGEPDRILCRIPVIMSSHEELAFSAHYLSSVIEPHSVWSIDVEAADGAPGPWIKRLSLLGDSLMREGINEGNLVQLLNHESRVWDSIDDYGLDRPWTTNWSPFGKQPDLRTFGPHLEDVEGVCIEFYYVPQPSPASLEWWLSGSFNAWCVSSMHLMHRDWIDGCVVLLPEPPSSLLGEE